MYGTIDFIPNAFDPTRLKEDKIYTWMKLIAAGFCQQKMLPLAKCWKRRKKEVYLQRRLVPVRCWKKRKKRHISLGFQNGK